MLVYVYNLGENMNTPNPTINGVAEMLVCITDYLADGSEFEVLGGYYHGHYYVSVYRIINGKTATASNFRCDWE
jgi:hypothetical protein